MANRPENMVALGQHCWLFESPTNNTTDYVVMAHSAQINGKTFVVPSNVTLHYGVNGGSPLTMMGGPVRFFGQSMRANQRHMTETRRSTFLANDLALGKVVGSHWTNGDSTASDDYWDLSRNMRASSGWTPNLVLVRNRNKFIGSEVYLSFVIDQVMRARPATAFAFHVWGCRGIEDEVRWKLGRQKFQMPP